MVHVVIKSQTSPNNDKCIYTCMYRYNTCACVAGVYTCMEINVGIFSTWVCVCVCVCVCIHTHIDVKLNG